MKTTPGPECHWSDEDYCAAVTDPHFVATEAFWCEQHRRMIEQQKRDNEEFCAHRAAGGSLRSWLAGERLGRRDGK